jgi:large subunit ribosomal protein L17
MVTSLFRHERIRTTKAKALEIRRSAEKLITRAKVDSVHNRRIASRRLFDEAMVAKLFTDIGPRMKDRPGGYTRILKLGPRYGDAAEVVLLELVDYKLDTGDKSKKDKDKKAKAAKAAKPKDSGKKPAQARPVKATSAKAAEKKTQDRKAGSGRGKQEKG